MYNIKKSPKEIFILFRGKFLEDIVKITLKRSKKSVIMAKGQWYLPYHRPNTRSIFKPPSYPPI